MRKCRFTGQPFAFALQQAEAGTPAAEVYRKMDASEPTDARRKQKSGGLMPAAVRRLRHFEEENTKLQGLVANLTLDQEMFSEVIPCAM